MFKTKYSFLVILVLFLSQFSFSATKSEKITYKDGEQTLEGFLIYNPSKIGKKKAPGVVVIHDWMGVGEYVKMRAEQLADMGYVAFVADIYGKDSRPANAQEASEYAGKYRGGDRKNMRSRLDAAFNELKKSKLVNTEKLAGMGYCFGGTAALEMARMGLPIKAAVSFHGGLSAPVGAPAMPITAKVLVLHGAIDPFVKESEVLGFVTEMNQASVDYQFVSYSGAVHSFTHKDAGNDVTKGAAYNELADKRSYVAMKNFFEEVLK